VTTQSPLDFTPRAVLMAVTDIYPTRYTAFDSPRTLVEFKPVDGKLRHCLPDSPPRPVTDFLIGSNQGELAVYSDPARKLYCEVYGNHTGRYFTRCDLGNVGAVRHYTTYARALSLAKRFIEAGTLDVLPARRDS